MRHQIRPMVIAILAVLVTASVLAQTPAQSGTAPAQSSPDEAMVRMHQMMHGRDGTGGMMGMCPMMGGAMGTGMMWMTMFLFGLFWIAAIFALVALGVYLLRRSQPVSTS